MAWGAISVMKLDHLRQQIDQFEHRAEEQLESDERHRLRVDFIAMERALDAMAEKLKQETALVESLRQRVQRLRAKA